MENWQILYYNETVVDEILNWPTKLLAKYLRIADLIKLNGPNLGMPLTRALRGGLFEIRVKAQEGIGRVLFCSMVENKIMVLHQFIKKTQKTPIRALVLARKRLQEIHYEQTAA